MKAWDTNFLVRHLTEDDPAQLAIARRELDLARRRNQPVWIAQIVLVETAWVLRHYGLDKGEVLEVLDLVTRDDRFQIEGALEVREAIRRSQSKGDLPEHLVALAARRAGAATTQTFDRAMRQFSEFEVHG